LRKRKLQLKRRKEEETLGNFRKSINDILECADELHALLEDFCREYKSNNYTNLLNDQEKKLLTLLMAAFALDTRI
jgi:endonuclease III-like uncharacterized protein